MKSSYKISLIALAVIGLTACNQDKKPEAATTKAATVAETPAASKTPAIEKTKSGIQLDTPAKKQAYSVGVSIGKYMGVHMKQQADLGLPMDSKVIVDGFTDGMNNKTVMSDKEMQTVLQNLNVALKKKRQEKAEESAKKAKADAEKAKADGKAFLAANKTKPGVKTTKSGLQYKVLTAGTGAKPKATDTVKVNYVGTLTNGTEFDSSIARGTPAKFVLNHVIPGWTEGVQLMSVGSKYKLFIPAKLAYGSRPAGKIPANSVLIFEVDLLSIEKPIQPKKPDAAVKSKK